MQDNERKIVKDLIQRILDRKLQVSVNDGEEWVVKESTNLDVIMDALASTDCDELRIHDQTVVVGWILLIWGNGKDVISDYSDNMLTNELVQQD